MNCPNCNKSEVEQAKGFYNGKPLNGVLANFCGGCGYDLRPHHEALMAQSDLKPFSDASDSPANDVVILYATCPDCGAQEEIGRAVNPAPEDLDQFTYGEPVLRLCETCQKKRFIVQTVVNDIRANGPIGVALRTLLPSE